MRVAGGCLAGLSAVLWCASSLAQQPSSETTSASESDVERSSTDTGQSASRLNTARRVDSNVPPASPETSAPSQAADLDPARRLGLVVTALGPGAVVHGTGTRVAGNSRAADKLLSTELWGLGIALGSIAGLAVTGASRYTVAPFALGTIGGVSLFGASWLADVHAVGTREDGLGRPALETPALENEIGYRYVYDPQFRYRNFLVQRFDLWWGPVRFGPEAWFAVDDQNSRVSAAASYRVTGPRPTGPLSRDGSFFDVTVAAREHRYLSDGFILRTAEASALGRLDLERVDPAFAGSFAELGGGVGLSYLDYDLPGVDGDLRDLLLARFGFGAYLADPRSQGGEVMLYYDHRHDDYAAGLLLTGLGSGNAGHFGLDARYFLTPELGFRADVQVGSAWVAGLSILVRKWNGRQ